MLWLGALSCLLVLAFVLLGLFFPLNGRINALVLGLDRRPGEGNVVRADAIMVVNVTISTFITVRNRKASRTTGRV